MLMFCIHGICVRFLGIKTGKPLETLAVFGLQSFRPLVLVGEDGFEPSKRYAADLQSVPFGHSGTPPYEIHYLCEQCSGGAGRRTRTPDLLITNQLLYQLSYTGGSNRTCLLYPCILHLSSVFLLFFTHNIVRSNSDFLNWF